MFFVAFVVIVFLTIVATAIVLFVAPALAGRGYRRQWSGWRLFRLALSFAIIFDACVGSLASDLNPRPHSLAATAAVWVLIAVPAYIAVVFGVYIFRTIRRRQAT